MSAATSGKRGSWHPRGQRNALFEHKTGHGGSDAVRGGGYRKNALHFSPFFFIKSPVLLALNNLSLEKFEEDIMKKLVSVLVVLAVSLGVTGCGNSPDGDKQRSSTTISPSL